MIEPIGAADMAGILALNNAHAQELSRVEQAGLVQLVDTAFAAVGAARIHDGRKEVRYFARPLRGCAAGNARREQIAAR